jgi:hypothetical protein
VKVGLFFLALGGSSSKSSRIFNDLQIHKINYA